MLKIFPFLISSVLMIQSVNAITFGGPGNDYGWQVVKTSDNGIALLGQIENQSTDIYIMKFDSTLNIQWTKSYGNHIEYDSPITFCQTFDDGYLIAGSNFNTNQATLLRLNSSGDSIWSRQYGIDPNTFYDANFIEQYSNDQYTIGIVKSPFTGGSNTYLCRTDTSGNITDTLISTNGGGNVLPVANGYLISGTISYLTPSAIILVRLDTVSGHSFTKTYYDPNLILECMAYNSAVSGNGFLTVGSTNLYSSNGIDNEFYLIQTDADGDSLWDKHWGSGENALYSITSAGNFFYATGNSQVLSVYSNSILKFDSAGDTVWTKNLGTDLNASSILEFSPGYFIVVGDSIDTLNGNIDIWLTMFDSLGNFVLNTTTSIQKTSSPDSEIQLYPTVATDFIQLKIKDFNAAGTLTGMIFTSTGKLIEQFQLKESTSNIDIRNYRPGSYILRLNDEKGKVIAVKKFIINSK